jgi:hypothetical protein
LVQAQAANENDREEKLEFFITCPIDAPQTRPLELLREIAQGITQDAYVDICVKFENNISVDRNGLRRDLMHRLFNTLSKAYDLGNGLACWNAENDQVFKDIGQIFKMFIQNIQHDSVCNTPIGEAFNKIYFEGLLAFSYKELTLDFASFSDDRILEVFILLAKGAEHEHFTKVKQLCDWNGAGSQDGYKAILNYLVDDIGIELPEDSYDDEKNIDIGSLAAIQKEVKEQILQSRRPQIQALHTIAAAMITTQDEWTALQNVGGQQLNHHIQGKFNKEDFKNAFRFDDDVPEEVQKTLLEWVEENPEEQSKKLTAFLHGTPSIPADGIKVQMASGMAAHICFDVLEIMRGITPKALKRNLNNYCEEDKAVFNCL